MTDNPPLRVAKQIHRLRVCQLYTVVEICRKYGFKPRRDRLVLDLEKLPPEAIAELDDWTSACLRHNKRTPPGFPPAPPRLIKAAKALADTSLVCSERAEAFRVLFTAALEAWQDEDLQLEVREALRCGGVDPLLVEAMTRGLETNEAFAEKLTPDEAARRNDEWHYCEMCLRDLIQGRYVGMRYSDWRWVHQKTKPVVRIDLSQIKLHGSSPPQRV